MSESIHSPGTEVTKRISSSLSQERLYHPVSSPASAYPSIAPSSLPLNRPVFPEHPAITPPSFPLSHLLGVSPAYPSIASSSFPLDHPAFPEHPSIATPPISHDPFSPEYPTITPSSFSHYDSFSFELLSNVPPPPPLHHPVSLEYADIAPPSSLFHHLFPSTYPVITSPSVSCHPGSLTWIDSLSECSLMKRDRPRQRTQKVPRTPCRRM